MCVCVSRVYVCVGGASTLVYHFVRAYMWLLACLNVYVCMHMHISVYSCACCIILPPPPPSGIWSASLPSRGHLASSLLTWPPQAPAATCQPPPGRGQLTAEGNRLQGRRQQTCGTLGDTEGKLKNCFTVFFIVVCEIHLVDLEVLCLPEYREK